MRRSVGLLVAVLACWAASVSGSLIIGRLTLVETSPEVPYAYWYYVPESARSHNVVGLVWHATPGDAQPDDPVFWARFDLPRFLACAGSSDGPRINLPEKHGFALFSIAVPEPLPAFYEERPETALGTPVALSSLLTFDESLVDRLFLDPDLKALMSVSDFMRRLTASGIAYDPRLFLTGVYRGAEWAHRFALLHPTRVRAVAPVCGNVFTMPFDELDGTSLPWPLGLADFESLERGSFDRTAFERIPYYVTASSRERVWYPQMSPEEQGVDQLRLDRYANRFGSIPPEHGESFAIAWMEAGYPFELIWSEGGHGWIDPVRARVFEYFGQFELSAAP